MMFDEKLFDEFVRRRWVDLAFSSYLGYIKSFEPGAITVQYNADGVIDEEQIGFVPLRGWAFTNPVLEHAICAMNPEKQVVIVPVDMSRPECPNGVISRHFVCQFADSDPAMHYYRIIQDDPTGLSPAVAKRVFPELNLRAAGS